MTLALGSGPRPEPGSPILRDDKSAGTLTTVTAAGALGFVRHALAQPGEAFDLEGGGRVTIVN